MTLYERITGLFTPRRESRSAAAGGFTGPGGMASVPLAGVLVTPQSALALTAVYSAIHVISRDVARLPLDIYHKVPGGGWTIDESHPVHPLLRFCPEGEKGTDGIDAFRFHQSGMGHALGWGNGFSEIARDGDGTPTALHLLHPSTTKPKRLAGGKLVYEIEGNERRRLLPENVLHFAGLGFDGLMGYSPIALARQAIGLGLAAEQYGAALFGSGAVPKGVLKTAKRLSDQAAVNLRERWNRVHQGSVNAHTLAILDEGMQWENTTIAPEDAQFLSTRQFQVVEIARLFSVPPHKIGDYSQAHLANVEEANLDYLETTLAGWVAMREAQLNLKLLSAEDRRTHEILHDMTALRRGNMAARIGYYQGMRNMGAMSADDIRTAEGLNPLGPGKGGDQYLVQSQYTPLDQVGVRVALAQPAASAAGRARRMNPNHDKEGKFASGPGGGSGDNPLGLPEGTTPHHEGDQDLFGPAAAPKSVPPVLRKIKTADDMAEKTADWIWAPTANYAVVDHYQPKGQGQSLKDMVWDSGWDKQGRYRVQTSETAHTGTIRGGPDSAKHPASKIRDSVGFADYLAARVAKKIGPHGGARRDGLTVTAEIDTGKAFQFKVSGAKFNYQGGGYTPDPSKDALRALRFNPNHDPGSGQFTSGGGGGGHNPGLAADPATADLHAAAERAMGVTFEPSPAARATRMKTVVVDVAALDTELAKYPSSYVGRGGTGAAIAGRYEQFQEFLGQARKTGKPVEMPEMSMGAFHAPTFRNGRHRFAVLRDEGAAALPLSVHRADAKEVKAKFGWPADRPVPGDPGPERERALRPGKDES